MIKIRQPLFFSVAVCACVFSWARHPFRKPPAPFVPARHYRPTGTSSTIAPIPTNSVRCGRAGIKNHKRHGNAPAPTNGMPAARADRQTAAATTRSRAWWRKTVAARPSRVPIRRAIVSLPNSWQQWAIPAFARPASAHSARPKTRQPK